MLRKLHLTNAAGRDATVVFASVAAEPGPALGLPGTTLRFARWLAATEDGLLESLAARHPDLSAALVAGDPEVDIEHVGRAIRGTDNVFLSAAGEVLHAAPRIVELVLGADGGEKERRAPVDTEANVNETDPLRWAAMRLGRREAVRRFVFARTIQVRHVDGLTYDYLHAMARELDTADAMVLVGAGPRGRDPLIFQANGTPWRAFLEGRVDGERYQLLLHLSNLELKRPAEAAGQTQGEGDA
jgi:hypothetical protein